MRRVISLMILALIATACSATGSTVSSSTKSPPTTTTVAPPPTTDTSPPDPAEQSPCLEGDRPFASGGVISAFGGASGDAAQISGIRAAKHPGCERIAVDLLTVDGAPAGSLGLTGVEYNEAVGVVRINLPNDITRTSITDLLLDGDLTNRAFVIRTAAGHLAVDIHVVAGVGVALRAFEVDAPSRIVVDLRSDDDAPPVAGAVVGDGVVVIEPAPGPAALPLQVTGYARTFEANVVARLHENQDDEPLAEFTTTATDWIEAWGEFAMQVEEAPLRPLELFVGADSPADGVPNGVWVPLDFSDNAVASSPET